MFLVCILIDQLAPVKKIWRNKKFKITQSSTLSSSTQIKEYSFGTKGNPLDSTLDIKLNFHQFCPFIHGGLSVVAGCNNNFAFTSSRIKTVDILW